MKYLSLFFGLVFLLLSCNDKETPPPTLNLKERSVNFNKEASTKSIAVETNVSDWSVMIPSTASSWLSYKKMDGAFTLNAKENTNAETREAKITVVASNLTQEITVAQMGLASTILLEKSVIDIDGKQQQVRQVITSKTEVEVKIPSEADWITLKESSKDENQNQVFVFSVTSNSADARNVEIEVLGGNNKAKLTSFRINQAVDPGYQAEGVEDVLDDIKIPVISGSATSVQPGSGNFENSFDGNYNTIYHSNWNNGSSSYFPITLLYNLGETSVLDYLIYYPRTDGPNGNFKEVDIYVSTREKGMTKEKTVIFDGSNSPRRVTFDTPIKNPIAVKFVVKSGAGSGNGFAAVGEMEFYRYNPKGFNPLKVFTDYSISQLKPGVTASDIEAIDNKLYKNIAYRLLKNEYPSEFRVQTYRAWPRPEEISPSLKSNTYNLLDNPTGIYVDTDDVLIVGVKDTHNQSISIKIQNLDKPGGDGYGQATYHPLAKGINKIQNHGKGLIYVLYHTPDYKNAPQVKIHFASGKVNGYFDSQKHKREDWARILNAAPSKYFDVIGEKAHLTFETATFRKSASDNGLDLINKYDELVKLEQDFMGFNKYNRVPGNRAYFHVMYHSYMYSTSYRTAYNRTTTDSILSLNGFTKNIWGPAHELGHTHQLTPGFKWQGMTEVSNNVLSEYLQTRWNGYKASRLDVENMGRYNNRYEKGYNAFFVSKGTRPHATDPDVFVKLIPFWQMYLIMAEVEKQPDFYKDVYEDLRVSPSPTRSGDAQVNFLLTMTKVAKIDFTDFFRDWGLLTPVDANIDDYGKRQFTLTQAQIDETINAIKAFNYPKANSAYRYITDSNFTFIRDKSDIVRGTFTPSGTRLTFNNWKNVVAFEVYNSSNDLIFASNRNTFTLDQDYDRSMRVYAIDGKGNKTRVN